jgi:hypothetical protein
MAIGKHGVVASTPLEQFFIIIILSHSKMEKKK